MLTRYAYDINISSFVVRLKSVETVETLSETTNAFDHVDVFFFFIQHVFADIVTSIFNWKKIYQQNVGYCVSDRRKFKCLLFGKVNYYIGYINLYLIIPSLNQAV